QRQEIQPYSCQVRRQDADALLYNTKSSGLRYRSGSEKVGTFKKQADFEVAGQELTFGRGWAQANFTWKGKQVGIITSHLEVESTDGVGNPNKFGPKNWPSEIQTGQAKELLKKSKKLAKANSGRAILLGDLNTDANGYYSPAYGNLTKNFFTDSWKQAGKKFGKAVGGTCCRSGALDSKVKVKGVKGPGKYMDSGDPAVPTRIDLILNRNVKATKVGIAGTSQESKSQPLWQSDHNFYFADVILQ
ncbi:MAG: hypothetical protein CMH41_04215, partial [Micrococcales bacterium]|nr:hypothetical protein [Micrococcales bacterium]